MHPRQTPNFASDTIAPRLPAPHAAPNAAHRARIPNGAVISEAVWYGFINWATMFVFLYMERENVGRFMCVVIARKSARQFT
ncbi:hypothetical protein AG1IA_02909 [Rhizoctonia solani AG-1 IA]|uniref:Uncharacterized protein n=1 Tax=Thanatephorus cucumeris (strain AG1-IA) TaxID=983506 RepID=L8WYH1_THACA|nr:hypothetical protein AG1IA_02909 [Rhizoctonia solani AG-1 IA]